MAFSHSETSHLLVNAELDETVINEDIADTAFLTPPSTGEVKSKLKRSDVINLVILCLDIVCQGMGYALISSFYPITAQKKGLSLTDVGIVMSALPMACLIFGVFFSYFLSKVGTRKLLLGSLFMEAASILPFAFVNDAPNEAVFYAVSMLCRTGQGIAFVSNQVSTFAIAAGDYNDRMSTVFGLFEMSVGVGLCIGPAIGGIFYDALGFQAPFFFLFAFSSVFFILTYIWVHPTYSFAESNNADNEPQNGQSLSIKTVWKVPGMLIPIIACITIFSNATFFDVAMAPFLSSQFKLSSALIGAVFFGVVAVYALFAPVVGYIIDKKGYKGLFMVSGCFLLAPAYMIMGPVPFLNLEHNLAMTCAALAVGFISVALTYVPVMGVCFQVALASGFEDNEKTRGFINSIFVTSGNIGNFCGPFIGGILMNQYGFEWAAFILGVITFFVGIVSSIYLVYKNYTKKLTKNENDV